MSPRPEVLERCGRRNRTVPGNEHPGDPVPRQKTVKVRVSRRDEACSVLAQGVVTLKDQGVARRFKLLSDGTSNLSGETKLRLAIPLRAYRAIRALGSDGTVTVKVRVTASDRFDNSASARQSIELKP